MNTYYLLIYLHLEKPLIFHRFMGSFTNLKFAKSWQGPGHQNSLSPGARTFAILRAGSLMLLQQPMTATATMTA